MVKITDSILFIHKSLLGESESLKFDGAWYNTGDIVSIISEEPLRIRFVSRQNEMINVGGYKVNPTEVEQAVRDIPGVKDAYVYAKANRLMGNVICCDVIAEDKTLTEQSIRKALSSHLQEFKIPRIVLFTDNFKITRTGKKDRTQ
jgi:acyl-CoA synthetase (AMP-forming)/AMP-acid ligase II